MDGEKRLYILKQDKLQRFVDYMLGVHGDMTRWWERHGQYERNDLGREETDAERGDELARKGPVERGSEGPESR